MLFLREGTHAMLLLPLLAIMTVVEGGSTPLVKVAQGPIQGYVRKSLEGRSFFAFEGIPYAEPPVGCNRFKEPQPAKPWIGVWNATSEPNICLQYTFTPSEKVFPRIVGEEDCLYVNVYTPKLPTTSGESPLLDVMIYIHGGGFMSGWGSIYQPTFLMDRDVVYVTFNYRLGILGFLSTEDSVIPGNNGLKDQNMALRWVNRNIAAFGGNVDSITLTGLSAGGASVHYHYLSPLSRGLFQKGISWSGSAFVPWAQIPGQKQKAFKLGALMGCESRTSAELKQCLKNRPARKLVEQTKHFQSWRYNPFTPFGPTVEVPGKHAFIDEPPVQVIMKGNAYNVPWMTSVTTEEGIYPAAEFVAKTDAMKELNEVFSKVAGDLLHFNYTVPLDQQREVGDKIRKFYIGEKKISTKTSAEIIKMLGDRSFVVEVERAARIQAVFNSAPVYFYEFAYRGKHSLSEFMSQSNINMGVSHGDDTFYLTEVKNTYCDMSETEEDRKMIKFLLDITMNFARTSNPTLSKSSFKWTPIVPKNEKINFLRIDGPSNYHMKSSNDLGNRKFWDSLPIHESQIVPPSKYLGKEEL